MTVPYYPGFSDSAIDVFLIAIRRDRDDGFTDTHQLQQAADFCNESSTEQDRSDCFVCFASMIDFVYD